jgi:hypothetical protein
MSTQNRCHKLSDLLIQGDSVEVKDAFINVIPLDVKTAEIITMETANKLGGDGLNLEHGRGQSYDNHATMVGVHSDVENQILDLNLLAVFNPCNSHSLRFVGVNAALVNVQALTSFVLLNIC